MRFVPITIGLNPQNYFHYLSALPLPYSKMLNFPFSKLLPSMYRLCSLLLLLLVLVSCKRSKFDSDWFTIKHDGKKRGYLVHEPPNFDASADNAVIIALHGGFGSPKNIEEQSGLSNLSDAEGFLVCYPEGLNRTWNADGCCGPAVKKNRDDVDFLVTLIDELVASYSINPGRVYVTGMSNGGFMAYRLACEVPEKIAAIAPVAGTMNVEVCNPTEPVAVLHIHSYEDGSVPWEGGIGNGVSDHYNPPIDSVLNAWSAHNGCTVENELVYDGTDFDQRNWTSCTDSTAVQLIISHDGGHSWPMGTKPTRKGDDPSAVVNANALMWAFFQAHTK